MLQINVSQLLKGPIGATRACETDEVVNIAGGDSRVQGDVTLVRTDRSILVRGTLKTAVELTCGRCLSLFRAPLTLDIEEEYYPTTDIFTGTRLPVPAESSGGTIDECHILDLSEAIQQYATLAMPMKPLCRENCAGLCPSCGHNLNQGECGCPQQEADPRWGVLRKLTIASTNET